MDTQTIQAATAHISAQEIDRPLQEKNSLANLGTLPADQQQILKLKYAAKPFSKLNDIEQNAHAVALLLKINVITGWPIPENDEHQNILAEQLMLFLKENFPLMNVEEITYAIRSKGTSISNWGKNMNLSLINEALTEYEKERFELSKLEESKRSAPKELPMNQKADWRPLLELYYQDYLKGKFNISVMPHEVYGAAEELKYISSDAWEDWYDTAKQMVLTQMQADKFECMHEKDRIEIEGKISKILSGESVLPVQQFARKLAIEFLYQNAKKAKFDSLYQN